jgi:hypothetical protein
MIALVFSFPGLAKYMSWLLEEAQNSRFEAVIWWLNRDYLDGAVAATCSCTGNNDTCSLTNTAYVVGGPIGEVFVRMFGNMALRNYDGSPRSGHATWRDYFARQYSP